MCGEECQHDSRREQNNIQNSKTEAIMAPTRYFDQVKMSCSLFHDARPQFCCVVARRGVYILKMSASWSSLTLDVSLLSLEVNGMTE